ncbi:sensor histidine kinase [Paraliobacillus sediminis]|uniref:sensor histidine kinase n=1 Tax=Paraliobacillus sediminis TaxID=1885916 RepID=UPI000E3DC285|nr:sensor histidine kinase [Paraliobacillus sediminis]
MIKIRTKLLLYFTVLLLFISILFFVREQSDQQVKELYEESSNHLLLLNDITDITEQTYQSLEIYVKEPIVDNLDTYEQNKNKLLDLQQAFTNKEMLGIPKKNFFNIITSFIAHTDQTIIGIENEDIQNYSLHLSEAEKTSRYIHAQTLDLINTELSNYQGVYKLEHQKIQQTKNMGTAIFLSFIVLSILFAIWFSNGITRTIDRLTRAAQEISAGYFSGKDVVISRKDELWFLTKTFNEMKKNIKQSVTEIEEKAKLAQLLKEMELKSLQNQINPHFLFNTLNTISKTSIIEGADRTNDLIASVSALLRYNIGNIERDTILKNEVEIVKEYFFIQKTRFGNRVDFVEKVDQTCLSTPIPCLTLQPIIENAFMHGIESMASGAKIELHIYQDVGNVVIDITDNGVGMEQETIDHLLEDKEEQELLLPEKRSGHSTGIGLRNVIDRLNLFDKDSKVTISSTLGSGSTVSIRLKKQQE